MFKYKKTLIESVDQIIEKYPERPAVGWLNGESYSYEKVGEKYREVAQKLSKFGIGFGDKVAILSENCPHWSIVYLAIISLGAVVVPILTEFHSNEVRHILLHSEAKAVFISKKTKAKFENAGIDEIIAFNIESFEELNPSIKLSKLKMKFLGEINRLLPKTLTEDDLAVLIYTSGTTGQSKGVMLTHKNLITNSVSCYNIHPVNEKDRFLSILPLPHTYESTLGFLYPLTHGSSVTYIKKPPTARVLLPAMQKVKPTIMLSVPLIMEKIYRNKIYPIFSANMGIKFVYSIPFFRKILNRIVGLKIKKTFGGAIKFFGIGGAKLAIDVESFLIESGFPYAIGYGLTETAPLIAGNAPHNQVLGSTGKVCSNLKCKIINKNPETNEGEIVVKGNSIMQGYFNDPIKTKEAFTDDGYFITGDLGVIKKGILYIKGRLKNVIIGPSGENIYPEEIESFINKSNYVNESIVYSSNGKLVARINLDYEYVDNKLKDYSMPESKQREEIKKILNMIKKSVNENVSSFSRISKVIEQTAPFEKTPTLKIKRFLYV